MKRKVLPPIQRKPQHAAKDVGYAIVKVLAYWFNTLIVCAGLVVIGTFFLLLYRAIGDLSIHP